MGTLQRNAWGGESDRWQNKGQWPKEAPVRACEEASHREKNWKPCKEIITLYSRLNSIQLSFYFYSYFKFFKKIFIYLFESRERRKHHSPSDSLPKYLRSLASTCQAVDQYSLEWWGPIMWALTCYQGAQQHEAGIRGRKGTQSQSLQHSIGMSTWCLNSRPSVCPLFSFNFSFVPLSFYWL